jgi:hypothetical protein
MELNKQMEMFEGDNTSIDTSKLKSGVKEKKDARKIQFDNMTKMLTSGKVKDLSIEEKDKFVKLYKMLKQHHSFNEGGLLDEGGMIDEVSGNDVPSGSTREEVRDDIPAQLSEGEFVFPADVVRFIGLEKLMQMRQKAKMGLQKMEDMGQMGNSEEATMPDDMPFDINDLDMQEDVDNESEMEYNRGGVVKAAVGTYVAPNVPVAYNPMNTTNQMTGNPTQMQQPTAFTNNAYASNPQNMYSPQGSQEVYAPGNYKDLLGASATGAPETESRIFKHPDGRTRTIPYSVATGEPLYPIDRLLEDGFVLQGKDAVPTPEPEKPTEKVTSAKVKPVDAGNDSRDQEEREREEKNYGPGAGRISLGGEIKPGTTVKTGFLGKGTSSLTKNATTFGIGYTVPGSLPGIYGALANVISIGTNGVPEGGTGKFTLGGVTLTKSAEVTNAILKKPMGPEATSLIKQHKQARQSILDLKDSNPNLSNKQARAIVDAFVQAERIKREGESDVFSIENIDSKVRDDYIDAVEDAAKNDDGSFNVDNYTSLPSGVQDVYNESVTQKEDEQQQYSPTPPSTSLSDMTPNNDDDNNDSSNDSPSDNNNDSGGFGDMSGMDFNKGGLAGKKKTPKLKKMKQGGLASR